MKMRLLRNATQVLSIYGKTILTDPMLAPEASYEPFNFTDNTHRNPLVNLPVTTHDLESLLNQTDAVLLTHLHPDHWDAAAQQLIRKDIPVICQPSDVPALEQSGFTCLLPVEDVLVWEGISIYRTGGQHGTGETGQRMGKVSGYVMDAGKKLYLAGDTIWCEEVREALDKYQPDYVVVNGGGAKFIAGDPIVMDSDDVIKVCSYAADAKVYVVHLEAVNHSQESREMVAASIAAAGLQEHCFVPEDGEVYLRE